MNTKRLRMILIVCSAFMFMTAVEVISQHEDPHWGYEGEAADWGKLSPKWSVCTKGQNQSPIELDKTSNEMKANFKPARLKIIQQTPITDAINNGHTIQVNYKEGDTLTIGEEQFQLLQHHFHSPSEHTVRGKHYPMEMHFVHKSADGKLAVIGVFIEKGNHNSAFDSIWSNLPKSKGMKSNFENVAVDISKLLPSAKTTYRYNGSLTTPSCSEDVKWIVMQSPIQLSEKQIQAFQNIINRNNRPVQPLNGRPVVTDSVEISARE